MAEKKTTEAAPDMEELVEYAAPLLTGTDAAPDIVVGVNGELIRIKRGETVRIKRKFVEVLRNAQAQESEARRNRERERARSARALADM